MVTKKELFEQARLRNMTLHTIENNSANWKPIEETQCPKCKSNLVKDHRVSFLRKCTNTTCALVWGSTRQGGLTLVGENESYKRANAGDILYKQNRRKFHLDFLQDLVCFGTHCMSTDEAQFCTRTGCPIVKIRTDLLAYENENLPAKLKNLKLQKLKSNKLTEAIKEKWAHLAKEGPQFKNDNIKFKLVYFKTDQRAGEKMTIMEPFPRNRFDTEMDAQAFLNIYCDQSGDDIENYYIGMVQIDTSSGSKKKNIITTLSSEIQEVVVNDD